MNKEQIKLQLESLFLNDEFKLSFEDSDAIFRKRRKGVSKKCGFRFVQTSHAKWEVNYIIGSVSFQAVESTVIKSMKKFHLIGQVHWYNRDTIAKTMSPTKRQSLTTEDHFEYQVIASKDLPFLIHDDLSLKNFLALIQHFSEEYMMPLFEKMNEVKDLHQTYTKEKVFNDTNHSDLYTLIKRLAIVHLLYQEDLDKYLENIDSKIASWEAQNPDEKTHYAKIRNCINYLNEEMGKTNFNKL